MKKENWNSNDYQGKRKDQVESSYSIFFVSELILLVLIGMALIEHLMR